MASQDAFLAHVVARMQADIDFLVAQGVMSFTDGQIMSGKLPSSQSASMMPTPMASPPPTSVMAPTPARRGVPLPPSRQLSQVPQARALWPYNENGQDAGDLSFTAGETIEILEETNADWWKGKNTRGETGLFPSNYVEKAAATPAPPAYPAGGRMLAPLPSGEKASYDPLAAPPPQAQEQQAQPPKKNKFGKYGNTMAQSAAGGVGFGAGAAIGGGLVRAIF